MAMFRKLKKIIFKVTLPLVLLIGALIIHQKIKNSYDVTVSNQNHLDMYNQKQVKQENDALNEYNNKFVKLGLKSEEVSKTYLQMNIKQEHPESAVTEEWKTSTVEPQTVKVDIDIYEKQEAKENQQEEEHDDKENVEENLKLGDIIYDYETIERLKHYKFKLRASDPNTIQRYLGGSAVKEVIEKCDNITYDLNILPTAAVVISFHENERAESILHTVHSLYENSPSQILKEIILIDDNSKKASHKEPLENYINEHFPEGLVQIHRHSGPENLGLIQGRLLGIKLATAKVIVVMDAHMEVQPKWLEPLVHAIYEQRNTMATSMLDWMRPVDDDTKIWYYDHGSPLTKTTWVWKTFNFGFRGARRVELDDKYPVEPINTPMSVGTIWAMDRDFFFEIGGFDDNMVLWGGENIDLPIRVHLCSGGRVVNIPCSKAGHQEMRHQRDYRYGWRQKFLLNFKRIAEVWLDDEYKETFYFYNQPLKEIDAGDLTERLKLKYERCRKSFGYYLERTFPEMAVDAISFGWKGMINLQYKKCFYYSPDNGVMKMTTCSYLQPKEQGIHLSLDGNLRQYLSVFNIVVSSKYAAGYKLARHDYYYSYNNRLIHTKWLHTRDGCLFSFKSKHCLAATENDTVILYPCNGTCTDPSMKWRFRKYTHYYKDVYDGKLHYNGTIGALKNYYQLMRNYMIEREILSQEDISNSETVFDRYKHELIASSLMQRNVN